MKIKRNTNWIELWTMNLCVLLRIIITKNKTLPSLL